jgi:hypothetical protein
VSSSERVPRRLPISKRIVFERNGSERRDLQVFCPMDEATLSIERCSRCSNCRGFEGLGDASERPGVRCAYEGAPVDFPDAWPVGSLLAPFAYGVRMGALWRGIKGSPPDEPLAVVDDALRFVAVCEPGPTVYLDNSVPSLALEEHVSLLAALGRLRRDRKRRSPVVSTRGTFLGTVDQSDMIRALRDST